MKADLTDKVYVQKAQIDFDEWLENEINKKEEESTYENL